MDIANDKRDQATGDMAKAETFKERLQARALMQGVLAADALGRNLVTYEQVGTIEAVAARNTLYVMQESARNTLVRQVEAKQAELHNLERTGNKEGSKTLLVMDESSMTGAHDAAKITLLAKEIGARVVFQGDIKQHGSVPAGEMFKQAQQAGINLSVLQETRRFDNATEQTKQAVLDMQNGDFSVAMNRLQRTVVDDADLASVVAGRYLANMLELKERALDAGRTDTPKVGVVVVVNQDRKDINAAIHNLLAENDIISKVSFDKSHLDDPKLTEAQHRFVGMLSKEGIDRLIYRKDYREIGVRNGDIINVLRYDMDNNRIIAVNSKGKEIIINPQRQDYFSGAREEVRHYSTGDRVEARENIKFQRKGKERVDNGTRGTITQIDKDGAMIKWDDGVSTRLNNHQLRSVDH
ncbi:MAG TPA: AAA family ATPase, partial [Burkholderiaceae bacterium]|nr:AAA family ATPase [Burkholderiaceae bacterium]